MARLGPAPNIGTGSVRRIAQLVGVFNGARFGAIRGNLDTRLRKLDAGHHDALVLAAAGLRRLGMASRISMTLPVSVCVPAPGQGIVAIEIRSNDDGVRQIVSRIDDADAGVALEAERALVEALGGGCQTPIGALASSADHETIELVAAVAALDGSRTIRATATGPRREAAAVGARAGRELMAQGADVILAEAQTRA
jgi:hydroxymethylbilane synthase